MKDKDINLMGRTFKVTRTVVRDCGDGIIEEVLYATPPPGKEIKDVQIERGDLLNKNSCRIVVYYQDTVETRVDRSAKEILRSVESNITDALKENGTYEQIKRSK